MRFQALVKQLVHEASNSAVERMAFARKRFPGIPQEDLDKLAHHDPTKEKIYLPWLAKMHAFGRMETDRDLMHISAALLDFERMKNDGTLRGQDADILRCNFPEDLYALTEKGNNATVGGRIPLKLPDGSIEIHRQGPYRVILITTKSAVMELTANSAWCVRNGGGSAEAYLGRGPLYLITKKNKPYAMLHPFTGSAKDVHNKPVSLAMGDELAPVVGTITAKTQPRGESRVLLPGPSQTRPGHIKTHDGALVWLLKGGDYESVRGKLDMLKPDDIGFVLQVVDKSRRHPELEKAILTNPMAARMYAASVIQGPWPEAEKQMLDAPEEGHMYASTTMHGKRWPALEISLIRSHNADAIAGYAINNIQGLWPDGEKRMLSLGQPGALITYAAGLRHGKRWPDLEKLMMDIAMSEATSPATIGHHMANYIKNVTGLGKWPEGEAYVQKHLPGLWDNFLKA